jgi:hypothetical protein
MLHRRMLGSAHVGIALDACAGVIHDHKVLYTLCLNVSAFLLSQV